MHNSTKIVHAINVYVYSLTLVSLMKMRLSQGLLLDMELLKNVSYNIRYEKW